MITTFEKLYSETTVSDTLTFSLPLPKRQNSVNENQLFREVVAFYTQLLIEKLINGEKPELIQLGIQEVGDEFNVWAVIPADSDLTRNILGEIQAKVNGYLLRGKPIKLFTTYFYPEYQSENIWQIPKDYVILYKKS